MSTKESTTEYILGQLASVPRISARKMFGEYALYMGKKVVGLICNDKLFIKITDEGKKFVAEHYTEGHAYKGAKVSMCIDEDLIEDPRWLTQLVVITERSLPEPKPKKKKRD